MLGKFLLDFAFYYPLTMAWFWIFGALNYYLRRERTGATRINPPELAQWPMVTLVVPCHNEGDNVRETVGYLADQDYPDFEIIAVNDGSRDNTGAILEELTLVYPRLRVLHFRQIRAKPWGCAWPLWHRTANSWFASTATRGSIATPRAGSSGIWSPARASAPSPAIPVSAIVPACSAACRWESSRRSSPHQARAALGRPHLYRIRSHRRLPPPPPCIKSDTGARIWSPKTSTSVGACRWTIGIFATNPMPCAGS